MEFLEASKSYTDRFNLLYITKKQNCSHLYCSWCILYHNQYANHGYSKLFQFFNH